MKRMNIPEAVRAQSGRGQSALEYLVTYGWAFVAMVIISISLWYTGAFDPLSLAGGGST
ncbi:hypothetical protein HY995_03385 [Candidatus Micrarchaeota archaeon]|nr:hypothetical protein [Candidatus Micrarchaeota archaeon]